MISFWLASRGGVPYQQVGKLKNVLRIRTTNIERLVIETLIRIVLTEPTNSAE
jgi:hypothetical protein